MNSIGNPFVECTSRDMSFQDVFRYWCDPFSCYAIDYNTLKKSTTPIIIEGPRGSGKTMILKYLSYFCQKERILSLSNNDILMKTIQEEGSLGVYFRYKDDFGSLFKSLNCSKESKNQLFLYYFEMYVLDEIIKILSDLKKHDESNIAGWNELISELCTIFNSDVHEISDFCYIIENKIQTVDTWVRKSRYLDGAESQLHQLIDGEEYISRVCRTICKTIPTLEKVKFLIIIDEYENASDYQRILNTLIKRVDHNSNITYRIGVRPKGMRTLDTNIGTEFLQIDRDFLLYVLQSQKMSSYKTFVREIANRRLEGVDFFDDHNIADIGILLGEKENLDNEALLVVKKRPEKHFEILKKRFTNIDEIVNALRYPKSPLMEMLNILWVMRGISCEKVKSAMESYLAGLHKQKNLIECVELARKYKLDYSDKYRYQLLFVLLGIYGQNKKYYSFNTFAYLSSGAVNDFISLCRNVFYLLDESYYDNVDCNPMIPENIQAIGAENTAIEQMDKIKLCSENGTEMYSFAMNIGNLFKLLHRDIYAKYPETNQFAFEDEIEIENRPILNDVRNTLIKWGVIVKKPRIQSISIGRRKGTLYYLNRIFSPIFCISFRTRGGYNFVMPSDLFERLLKESWEPEKIKSWKKDKTVSSLKNKSTEKSDFNQLTLFEVMNYED